MVKTKAKIDKQKIMKVVTRNEKAITLISLIVIIIVLLILAGVSIATLMGDNGIITVSGQQKDVLKPSKMRCKIKTSKF